MNIEAITTGPTGFFRASATVPGADQVQRNREVAKKNPQPRPLRKAGKANQVQPEELLQSIKALTDNGAYSVRFEMHKETDELVINLIEQESGEVIRQIPAEEILGLHKAWPIYAAICCKRKVERTEGGGPWHLSPLAGWPADWTRIPSSRQ